MALCRALADPLSDPVELDVLPGVNGALEPLGHVADAVPRVAAGVHERRLRAVAGMRHGGQLRHGPLRAVRLRGEGSRCHVCFGQSLGERRFGYAELDHSATQIGNDAVSLSFVHGCPDSAYYFLEGEPISRADRAVR